jgi:glycosyltransferase involved in cell wall biosynthesis
MRIGIDCRTILNPGKGEEAGVGHYTYYLVKNLLKLDTQNQYVLFFDNLFTAGEEFKQPNVEICTFPFYQYKKYLPVAYSQMLIAALLNKAKLDVFHSPANVYPLPYSKPTVVTVHDLAIYKYPKFFPKALLNQAFSTKVLVPRSLIGAKKIIAISKNTKSDIVEEFGIPESKIEVIYQGVDTAHVDPDQTERVAKVRERYGIPGKYILFVGTLEPRKNLTMLVKAFRNIRITNNSPLKEYQLILVGPRGWHDKPIYEAIADANASILGRAVRRSGTERRSGHDLRPLDQRGTERRSYHDRRSSQPIKYIGYVSAADKWALMSAAACFVYPSFYEGFGLPVAEAMSLGVPVITTNAGALPEIVGKDGGILIDPSKQTELENALTQIITDSGLRESLVAHAKTYVSEFNWETTARETLQVYREVGQKS